VEGVASRHKELGSRHAAQAGFWRRVKRKRWCITAALAGNRPLTCKESVDCEEDGEEEEDDDDDE
jgi:hypothetical protein